MSESEEIVNEKERFFRNSKRRYFDEDDRQRTSSNSINNILFYGNSAMEFHRVINKIESAFIQESCYELIKNGLLLPDANGIYPETTFNEAEPIEPDYNVEILERSNIIRANAQSMIEFAQQLGNQLNVDGIVVDPARRRGRGNVQPVPVVPAVLNHMNVEVTRRIFDIQIKCEEDVLNNEQSRDKRQSEWNIRHVNYLKKKKEYDSKVAKALKIFHDRIGPKAYDHIKRHLRVSPPQLRNAFNTLKKTYDLSHGGADNAIEIVRIMDAERFNFPYQLAHQFATKMEEHAIRANEVENGIIRPNMLIGYIIKGIEKNAEGLKEYVMDIDDIRRNNRSLEMAKVLFQKHDSRLQLNRISEKRARFELKELNSKTGHIVDNCTLPSVEDGTYEEFDDDDDDDDDNQSNETDDNSVEIADN